MKNIKHLLFVAVILSFVATTTNAHCEIPCGIFHDSMRIELIKEHITTIEKSINMINKLSAEGDKNYNQIVRWVVNKEEHANKIQDIVSQYFLHQRVKLADPNDKEKYKKYLTLLTSLHEISVYAMKSKQTTDLSIIEKLQNATDKFAGFYLHKHKH